MPLSPGQILNNRYRIVSELGRGGFGAVYKAWDLHLNLPCAVKENLDSTQEAQRQFEHEAMLLAKLNHPNLPRVIDHFFLPGQGQYLVMDFIAGENLEEYQVKHGGPLPEDLVLSWVRQICSALSYLHAQQEPVIHRDIKPANIKVTPQGQVYLVDFGIAKIYDEHLKTTAGARAVTPGYSPPEQYGFGKTDPRSDIYALGATMYKALTGQDPPESVHRSIGTPLTSPRLLNRAINRRTEDIILKAMDTKPTGRFQTAAELSAILSTPGKPVRRGVSPWLIAGGIAGGLVLCIGTIFGGIAVYDSLTDDGRVTKTEEFRVADTDRPISSPDLVDTAAAQTVAAVLTENAADAEPGTTPEPPQPPGPATLPPDLIYTQAALTLSAHQTVLAGTVSPTPSSTPTPTPTITLSPTPTRDAAGGGLIAFHSDSSGNREIWVMNTDGSNPQQITFNSAWDSVPAWSPDGRELAFQSDRDGDFELYIYNLETGATRQVTRNSCADYCPTWSPDGDSLLYYSNCGSGSEQREIFTIGIDGDNNRQLTDYGDHNNRYPIYSPDGTWITFTGYDGDGYYVHLMRPDGSDIRRISRGCISSFSPDGSLLLFTSYCEGGEVNIMNLDGSGEIQLTDTPSFENSTPAWTSDGRRILFQSNRDGDSEIYIMNVDGSGVTQLTFNRIHDGAAVWQP
mgnify:FL=1